jgi:hypothetical protein
MTIDYEHNRAFGEFPVEKLKQLLPEIKITVTPITALRQQVRIIMPTGGGDVNEAFALGSLVQMLLK